MSSNSLYEPSLSAGTVRETRSYNIGSLVYVAFFGGVLALSVLGTKNARQLNIKPSMIQGLIGAAIIVFLAKMGFYYAYFHELIELDRSIVKLCARGAELLLFGGFFMAMRKAFRIHTIFGGETESLWKAGILWCIISAVVESICLGIVANI